MGEPPVEYPGYVDSPYVAEIKHSYRWGPFAWQVTFTKGICEIADGWFAWTRSGAERKARRLMRRWERREMRSKASTYTI